MACGSRLEAGPFVKGRKSLKKKYLFVKAKDAYVPDTGQWLWACDSEYVL